MSDDAKNSNSVPRGSEARKPDVSIDPTYWSDWSLDGGMVNHEKLAHLDPLTKRQVIRAMFFALQGERER